MAKNPIIKILHRVVNHTLTFLSGVGLTLLIIGSFKKMSEVLTSNAMIISGSILLGIGIIGGGIKIGFAINRLKKKMS